MMPLVVLTSFPTVKSECDGDEVTTESNEAKPTACEIFMAEGKENGKENGKKVLEAAAQ